MAIYMHFVYFLILNLLSSGFYLLAYWADCAYFKN